MKLGSTKHSHSTKTLNTSSSTSADKVVALTNERDVINELLFIALTDERGNKWVIVEPQIGNLTSDEEFDGPMRQVDKTAWLA
jgi:hypothetical protein